MPVCVCVLALVCVLVCVCVFWQRLTFAILTYLKRYTTTKLGHYAYASQCKIALAVRTMLYNL